MRRAIATGAPEEFVASVRLLAFHLRRLSDCGGTEATIYSRYASLYEEVADSLSESPTEH